METFLEIRILHHDVARKPDLEMGAKRLLCGTVGAACMEVLFCGGQDGMERHSRSRADRSGAAVTMELKMRVLSRCMGFIARISL
jgi:hypothetical protein